ncbi:BPG-independent [Mycena olivaceomarginata]|nr:BPG-independent [Mycena olivaceomarginata]
MSTLSRSSIDLRNSRFPAKPARVKNKVCLVYATQERDHPRQPQTRERLRGLISDGGVHSHDTHLYALLETAKEQGVPETYVHFFGDGRDTAPRSAAGYCQDLLDFMKKKEYGAGDYGAMDEIKANYEKDVTDEFLKTVIVKGDAGRIKDGDTLFFFNYRSDRMRERVTVLGLPEKPMEVTVPKDLHITTMSRHNTEFPFPVAFPPQAVTNVLAEWLGGQGVKQAHVAETEKYAHVTFFFNGGVEKQFEGEERFMIPSPKVATYDLQPEMSVQAVADEGSEHRQEQGI